MHFRSIVSIKSYIKNILDIIGDFGVVKFNHKFNLKSSISSE